MLKRPYIAPFTFSEEVIYIATPEDLINAKALWDNTDFTPLDRRRTGWVQSIFHRINREAKNEVKKSFVEGKFLVVYPEAGRSKDGFLRRAPREVSIYFPRDYSTVIIPVVINGPDKINPPGQNWTLDRVHPSHRQNLEIEIGEPYSSYEIWHWPDERSGRNRNPADWIMANIIHVHQKKDNHPLNLILLLIPSIIFISVLFLISYLLKDRQGVALQSQISKSVLGE